MDDRAQTCFVDIPVCDGDLTHFLEDIDGLLSTPNRPGCMVVLATNLPDNMDPALRSRIRVVVAFKLPAVKPCTCWRRAKCLAFERRGLAGARVCELRGRPVVQGHG